MSSQINSYKNFIEKMSFQQAGQVLSPEQIQDLSINDDDQIVVLSGLHFRPKLYGFTGPIPTFTDYLVVFLKTIVNNSSKVSRNFICSHHVSDLTHCDFIFQDLSKLLTHSIQHTKQRNHVCPEHGCEKGYAKKCNLGRHIKDKHN